MSLTFTAEKHEYKSIDIFDETKWVSASRLPSYFKKQFDPIAQSEKASKNKKSKWYGLTPEEIRNYWTAENVRSTTLGTWYHEKEEAAALGKTEVEKYGKVLPIFKPIWEEGVKYAPDQKLVDGVYPEHLAYLKSAGVCGQFDEVIVSEGYVRVDDFKTNKDLMKPAFVNYEGISEKFLAPLLHLEATKINEYALQLSICMYIILRHNPQLKAGPQTINYITFELQGEDQFGYPVIKLDSNNEPIVKDVQKIKVPYLKREVEIMFDWLKNKR